MSLRDTPGRTVEWESGGVDAMGLTIDTAGICWLHVTGKKGCPETEMGFELTPLIASELIAELAKWVASEADAYESMLRDEEKRAEGLAAMLAEAKP
jgi:hypothetical protein